MGSFLLHALVIYVLSSNGASNPTLEPLVTPPGVINARILGKVANAENEVPDVLLEALAPDYQSIETPASMDLALNNNSALVEPPPVAIVPKNWLPQEPSVLAMPTIDLPQETQTISGSIDIEIILDKEGKPTSVRIVQESPASLFTEWAWQMGMSGTYNPKISTSGPIESKLTVHFDIAPGVPAVMR